MAAKYQVYKDVAGKYRFRLKTDMDKIVVVSEAYEQHASALNGVQSIQNNCTVGIEDLTVEGPRINFPKYQVFKDIATEFRFRLTASNGQIIGASEAYETKESVLNGIKSMQASCGAEIEDLTVTEKMAAPEPMMQEAPAPAITPVQVQMPPAPAEPMIITTPPPPMSMAEPMLELYKLPDNVSKGEIVSFKGKLSQGDVGIPNIKIRIFEHDRSFMLDSAWIVGYTDENGSFNLSTKVIAPHFWDNTAKIYAQADGDHIKQVRSDVQKIIIG